MKSQTMKKSQLKEVIKSVVRECLNERCGGKHLAGGKKGKRMFKHIKTGYEGEKSPEDAECIAAATVNKNLGEAGLTSENAGAYDEKEEIMLIKVMSLIAKKLEDMHKGEEIDSEPVDGEDEVEIGVGNEEPCEPCNDKSDDTSDEYEEPVTEPGEESSAETPSFGKKELPFNKEEEPEEEEELDETAYKTQGPSYKTFKDSAQFPKSQNDPRNA